MIMPTGQPLTAKQKEVLDLKNEGKTNQEIATILGVSSEAIEHRVTAAYKKIGRKPKPGGKTDTAKPPQTIDYDQAVLSKVVTINETMQALGIPDRMRVAHIRRLKVKHTGEVTPVQAIADEAMKTQIREKIALAFSYMDDKAMSEATFRDLSVGSTALIEKLQLLEGKPTQIISDLERKNLLELMPLLIAEAQRRGLTLDGKVTEKVVGP